MHVCTILPVSQLAQARALARSLEQHHPDAVCTALVLDAAPHDIEIDPASEPFDLVTPDEIGLKEFDDLAALYDAAELGMAVKPWLLRHVIEKADGDAVLYLDPDVRIYGSLDESVELARRHGLVLNPNLTVPIPTDDRIPDEADLLCWGTYNQGFVGLGDTPKVREFVEWWAERTARVEAPPVDERTEWNVSGWFERLDDEMFTDRGGVGRWLDLAAGLVPDLHLLRDPGSNAGYWNIIARDFEADDGYTVDGRPLRFFHFDGFEPRHPELLSSHQNRILLAQQPALLKLCADYAAEVKAQGHEEVADLPYAYDTLPDGTVLEGRMRELYREASRARVLTSPIFTERGRDEFFDWLRGPASSGGKHGVNRYLHRVYVQRPDLQRAFPELDREGADLVRWAGSHGTVEESIPEELLPAVAREVAAAAAPAPSPVWGVNVVGFLQSDFGLAEAGRLMIRAFDAVQVPVLPVHAVRPGPPTFGSGDYSSFGSVDALAFPVSLFCMNGDGIVQLAKDAGPEFFKRRYSIAVWFWELDEVPEDWRGGFDHLDEIWVASRYIADSLAAEAPIPVVKVPLPVSVPETAPGRKSDFGIPEDNFLFLFMFDHLSIAQRKNPHGVIEAFKRAFPPGSGASLLIKGMSGDTALDRHERLRLAAGEHPDIHVIDRHLPTKEKNALMAACDCYVSLHRAEGFGLTPAEAMYLGKPVIATRFAGPMEFMTPENSYLVDYEMAQVGEEGYPPYMPTSMWADPDLDQAARYMREVFENPEEARERGRRAAADVRRTHSAEVAGEAMKRRLEAIKARISARPAPEDERGELVRSELTSLRASLAEPPAPRPRSRLARLLARPPWKLGMLLTRPFRSSQRRYDEQLVAALERIEAERREREQRLRAQMAMLSAELLEQFRRQDRRLEDAVGAIGTPAPKPEEASSRPREDKPKAAPDPGSETVTELPRRRPAR